tara:strand:- start:303 stop:419 length:117 start_codon:yes stop_codon:yes gene_type:complete
MLKFILKRIINLKNQQSLDAKLWIQRALLVKKFKRNPF